MARSLRSYPQSDLTFPIIVQRRLDAQTGGLGFLSARDLRTKPVKFQKRLSPARLRQMICNSNPDHTKEKRS